MRRTFDRAERGTNKHRAANKGGTINHKLKLQTTMSDKPVSSPEVRRAIIVGGGPAGMSLAIALRARGVSSVVLERRTLEECLAQRSSGYDLSPSGPSLLCAGAALEDFIVSSFKLTTLRRR